MITINIRGIDRLEFGIDIIDYKNKFRPILLELKEKKETGQELGMTQQVNYKDLLFDVGATGIKFYAYKITCKDFMMAFAEKLTNENPPIRVIFNASYLWSYGYKKAYSKFLDWFKIFPGEIEKTRLSRLDICLDTDRLAFSEEDRDLFITRARAKANHYVDDSYTYGKKFSGFTIGRGNPMLARIYNKKLEIETKGKEWFKEIWKENGWNEKDDVWRIEYQLRRKALKELSIDKVEDVSEKEDQLWHYLTTNYLKMDHPKWEVIKKPLKPELNPLIREKIKQGDLKKLTNQVNGLIISIGAYIDKSNIDEVQKYIKANSEARLKLKNTSFKNEVQKRRMSYLEDLKKLEGI